MKQRLYLVIVMTPTDQPGESGEGGSPVRSLRERLPDPVSVSVLGLVSVPGYIVPALADLRVFALFFLFGFWPFVRMALPGHRENPTAWVRAGGRPRQFLLSSLVVGFNPFVLWQGLRQLSGQVAILVRYRGRLPTPESFESPVSYRLPVDGEWTVVNGSHEREHSHSWGILTQRYAYDLLVTDDEGRTHAGDGTDPETFHCFDLSVVAPADGVVVAASDSHPDHDRIGWVDLDQRSIIGNYVTIRHAPDEYSVLAHLKRGSVVVSEGDRVVAGQAIGRCGHSGNSTEPHLHFHLQDRADFFTAMGLPIRFDRVAAATGPDGAFQAYDRVAVTAGQRVKHAGVTDADRAEVTATTA
jgi:hypothetical protein